MTIVVRKKIMQSYCDLWKDLWEHVRNFGNIVARSLIFGALVKMVKRGFMIFGNHWPRVQYLTLNQLKNKKTAQQWKYCSRGLVSTLTKRITNFFFKK